jgi:hypothetical protein
MEKVEENISTIEYIKNIKEMTNKENIEKLKEKQEIM